MSGRSSSYRNLETGSSKKKRSRDSDGSGVVYFFGGVILLLALGLSIWALVEAKHGYDPYCRSGCCKTTRVHEHFDFSNPQTAENFCIDRSTDSDDADCPFIFFPITYGITDGADGSYEIDDGVLTVDSTPFTLTNPFSGDGPALGGGLDHVKFLTYVSDRDGAFKAFPTRSTGSCADATELVIEANVTCEIDLALYNMPYGSGVPFPSEDYRLAGCGFNTIALQDFNNGVGKGAWQVADFFLTNAAIFIVNERLPFGKPGFGGTLNDYAAFTQFTKVAQRGTGDFHKLAIAYNAAKQTIRYLIDDEEVYKVTRPGQFPHRCDTAILHGGEPENSFPEYVSAGFGTFTILDAYHWDNGLCEGSGLGPLAQLEATPNAYYDPHHYGQEYPTVLDDGDWYTSDPSVEDRIWGQGADISIDYLRVYNQKCSCGA